MPSSNKLESIIKAAESGNPSQLADAVRELARATDGGLAASLKQLKQAEYDNLGRKLTAFIAKTTKRKESAQPSDKESSQPSGKESESSREPLHLDKATQDSIKAIVSIVSCLITDDDFVAPEGIYTTVCALHDILQDIGEINKSLQSEIITLCENWILQQRHNYEAVVPLTIASLLSRVLEDPRPVDVKRLWKLRSALSLLQLGDDSCEQLRLDLLKCIIQVAFLSMADGRKFIAYLFTLDPAFIDLIHKTIKSCLPHCKKHHVEAYAEIYYKAWKNSTGRFRVHIEHNCIQDFIFHCIHTRNQKTLRNVKRIINYFLDARLKDRSVEEMLPRLYEPILWRSLHVANPIVRENAVDQLGRAFPLVRSDQPQREIDEAVSMGIQRAIDCLNDSHPNVRRETVLAIGRILSTMWELLPHHILQALVEQLVTQTVFDKSSVAVREAVVVALTAMLDNHLSHGLLKSYLPKLNVLMYDVSDRVRERFVELLAAVKKVKLIKFYDIISVEDLLKAMAKEKSDKIRSSIATLLSSTFFPWFRKELKEVLQRSYSLIESNHASALAFFEHLDVKPIPPSVIVNFISKLFSKIVTPWIRKRDNTQESDEDKDDARPAKRSKNSDSTIASSDDATIQMVLKIIALLWEKIGKALTKEENLSLVQKLQSTFSDELLTLCLKHLPACNAIYRIAAKLPISQLPNFSKLVLESMAEESTNQPGGIMCIFSWGDSFKSKVLEKLNQWLAGPLEANSKSESHKPNKEKRKPRTKQDDHTQSQLNVQKALKILIDLTTGPEWIRNDFLACEGSNTLLLTLGKYIDLLKSRLEREAPLDGIDDDHLFSCYSMYYKLIIHAVALRGQTATEQEVMADNIKAVIGFLEELANTQFSFVETDLPTVASEKDFSDVSPIAFETLRLLIRTMTDLVVAGKPTLESVLYVVEILEKYLNCVAPPQVMSDICLAAWKCILNFMHRATVEHQAGTTIETSRLASVLTAALMKDPEGNISSLGLRSVFLSATSAGGRVVAPIKTSFMNRVFDAVKKLYSNDPSAQIEVSDLSQDVSFIIVTIKKHSSLLSEFLSFVTELLSNSKEYNIDVWTTLQILSVIVSSTPPKSALAPIQSILLGFLANLRDSDSTQAKLRESAERLLQQLRS